MNEEVKTEEDAVADEITVRRGRKPKVEHDDHEPVTAPKFPVKLLRNYRPVGEFTICDEKPSTEGKLKVFAGTSIEIGVDEAKAMMASGIAVRNDPISA